MGEEAIVQVFKDLSCVPRPEGATGAISAEALALVGQYVLCSENPEVSVSFKNTEILKCAFI